MGSIDLSSLVSALAIGIGLIAAGWGRAAQTRYTEIERQFRDVVRAAEKNDAAIVLLKERFAEEDRKMIVSRLTRLEEQK